MGRWQTLYDCSFWLLENHGRQLARDGWTTSDVFGVLPQKERWGGLVDRLGDCRDLTLDPECARWASSIYGEREFHRGTWPDLEAWWEVRK